ncbi:MAG: hypothetical protein JW940_33800 [Polyangiaceae bacterium]|nr:hypothetical protein [Polyangiaceae bacterium]
MKALIPVSIARRLLVSLSAIVAGCTAQTDTPVLCDAGLRPCQSGCVNMTSDATNCGACGNVCPTDQECIASVCTSKDATTIENTSTCPEPTEDCAGTCIDTTVDPANCGACSNACPEGQTCKRGKCGCPDEYTLCGDGCVDMRTDLYHCGGCDKACSGEETCIAGSCECQAHLTRCVDVCVDLQASGDNCGLCGHACDPGLFCGSGLCVSDCPSDTAPCGASCVSLDTDPGNCGDCGVVCPTGQSCVAGICDCPEGFMDCGDTQCTNLQTDIGNCGSCGTACASGQTCANGVCACTVAGQTVCNGACVSVSSDPVNCGACGVICASDKSCTDGACVGTAAETGGTSGVGGATTAGGRTGGRTGGTGAGGASGGGTGAGSIVAGYHVHGAWKGKAWTSTDTAHVASITPADFDNLTTDGPYCASGTVPATSDYSAVAMIGFNVNQASTTDAPASTWTPTSITSGGVVVNVTNRGASTVLRVQLLGPNGDTVASDRWCYELSQFGRDVTIPWTSFNTECWQGGSGVAYAGEPIESAIVLVPGTNAEDRTFDFCVNDIGPA